MEKTLLKYYDINREHFVLYKNLGKTKAYNSFLKGDFK